MKNNSGKMGVLPPPVLPVKFLFFAVQWALSNPPMMSGEMIIKPRMWDEKIASSMQTIVVVVARIPTSIY